MWDSSRMDDWKRSGIDYDKICHWQYPTHWGFGCNRRWPIGSTGTAIGATIAGAALDMPQPVVDRLCKSRSPTPPRSPRGGRSLNNPISPGDRGSASNPFTTPGPVKPMRVESPSNDRPRAGRSTSPRNSDAQSQDQKIHQLAEVNQRLMYQIGAIQDRHNQELEQANLTLANTSNQLDVVETKMSRM